jgi:hypothetical protein
MRTTGVNLSCVPRHGNARKGQDIITVFSLREISSWEEDAPSLSPSHANPPCRPCPLCELFLQEALTTSEVKDGAPGVGDWIATRVAQN